MSCRNCEEHYERTYIRVGTANVKIQGCREHLAQLIAIHRSQQIEMVTKYKEETNNPNWDEFDNEHIHIQDWRTYIPKEVRENWNNLSLIGKCAAISCCQEMADNENWD